MRCAICHNSPTDHKKLAFDYDPDTNKIRGLLCANCDAGLEMFQDRIRMLAHAIVYLEEHGKTYQHYY